MEIRFNVGEWYWPQLRRGEEQLDRRIVIPGALEARRDCSASWRANLAECPCRFAGDLMGC